MRKPSKMLTHSFPLALRRTSDRPVLMNMICKYMGVLYVDTDISGTPPPPPAHLTFEMFVGSREFRPGSGLLMGDRIFSKSNSWNRYQYGWIHGMPWPKH